MDRNDTMIDIDDSDGPLTNFIESSAEIVQSTGFSVQNDIKYYTPGYIFKYLQGIK